MAEYTVPGVWLGMHGEGKNNHACTFVAVMKIIDSPKRIAQVEKNNAEEANVAC